MFVWNIKFNLKFVLKIIFIIAIIILLGIFIFSGFKIVKEGINSNQTVSDTLNLPSVSNIDSANFTNVLKAVHDNLNRYIGQKISFTGYVYRVSDLNPNEFIVARDMVINSNNQALIVGFLCTSKNVDSFKDDTWVNVTGIIKKGDYHGEIPIVEVLESTDVTKPEDALVYPPEEAYVPTSAVL